MRKKKRKKLELAEMEKIRAHDLIFEICRLRGQGELAEKTARKIKRKLAETDCGFPLICKYLAEYRDQDREKKTEADD